MNIAHLRNNSDVTHKPGLAILTVATLSLLSVGCGKTENGTGTGSGTGTGTGSGTGTGGTGGGTDNAIFSVQPENLAIQIIDGAAVTENFTATLDGVDVTAETQWSFSLGALGSIESDGAFTANGEIAGTGTVNAIYETRSGSAAVSIQIKNASDPGGVGANGVFDGDTIGPDPALSLSYPYNNTVFPRNVASPEVMWSGGSADDLYKLHIEQKNYEYTVFLTAPPPSRFLFDQEEWRRITESGTGAESDPLTVTLQRKSGDNLYDPVVQTWKVAQARLPGSVHYWQLPAAGGGNGKVLKLSPATAQGEEIFQPADGEDASCYGCHTVSRDGRTVAAFFSNGVPFQLKTIDVTETPGFVENSYAKPETGGVFAAFNPDASKLVVSYNGSVNAANSPLQIVDRATGVVDTADLMGLGCGEPAWSPDGKMIAATCGYDGGGFTFDASNADLKVAQVNPDGISVAAPTAIVEQSAEGTLGRPAYPNFSPDSKYLIYGRPEVGSRSIGAGTIWMVDVDGQNPKQLLNAASSNHDFNPTFAPIRAGGYYWVAFMSRRDFGNRLVGADRQQIWVTAIKDPPEEGDPSQPAFYLRGQDENQRSENAFFAADACQEIPMASCETGIDCCGGHCIPDPATGDKTCGEPGSCSLADNACETSSDCCSDSAVCTDGFCQNVIR